jgi:DegV family protein with EDD domain
MRKIGLVLDSAFDLLDEVKEGLTMEVARMNIIIDGVSYVDGTDISLEEVVEAVVAGKKVTTSQPSPEAYKVAYENLIAQGVTDIIVMTVSRVLSGSFQSAEIAKEFVEGVNIELVNSKTSAMGGELLIVEAKEMILNNEDILKIKTELEELVERSNVLLTVDDLSTLYKGGRMNKTQSIIGTLMKIKPVITVNFEGYLDMIAKVRTSKKVVTYMIDKITESIKNVDKLHVRIGHIMSKDIAIEIKRRIHEKFQNAKVVISNEITPVVAVHLGKGGFGVSWIS